MLDQPSLETRTMFKLVLSACVLGVLLSSRVASALTGSDTCAAATLANDSLASPLVVNDTTVGAADDIDVATGNPACTEAPVCTGQTIGHVAAAGGMTFSGTGTAPDRVFRFRVDSACTLSVSMTSTTFDLNLMFSRGGCGNTAADCSCVDDSNVGGQTENLTDISVAPLIDYYIIVDGYTFTGNPPAADTFSLTITRTLGTCNLTNEVCGNSSTGGGEACDDGNTDDCDGCRGDCSAEETGCGDGFECGAEVCDDANTNNCDGCRSNCLAEETGCGDGFTCGAEVCDDSNTDSCDGCNGDCSVAETGCGDSVICPGEDCDDDNTTAGDGCSATCTVEEPVTSVDAGSDGGMSLLDASGGNGEDASPATGGTPNVEPAPDASSAGTSNGGNGGGGSGGDGVGGRNLGGFGNLNPGGSGGSTANPAADEKPDSGCGCVMVGSESATPNWLALFGVLGALALRRRAARALRE